uniref:Uncharacterized protein n=1 Tax=Romanomermis culicivorax TaxID=13658 RepID=A0A915JJ89_ROMCU
MKRYNNTDKSGYSTQVSDETGTNHCHGHNHDNATTGCWNTNVLGSSATSSCPTSTNYESGTTDASARHSKSEQNSDQSLAKRLRVSAEYKSTSFDLLIALCLNICDILVNIFFVYLFA